MGDRIVRFTYGGADFEISVFDGFLVVDIATHDIDDDLKHPGDHAIPKVRIRLNEDAIDTSEDGPWVDADGPLSSSAYKLAAANDMLAALEAYVRESEERCIALGWESVAKYREAHQHDDAYPMALAAIKKARGT